VGVGELGKLIPQDIRFKVSLEKLQGKTIALDAYNALYQFLASIRQPDGTPLMDSKGRITSHLSGLFYRTINLLEAKIWPVYVFDGKPPELKLMEIARRKRQKEEALEKWLKAKESGKVEEARKYAQRALFLTDDMVENAKKLLTYMGVAWVQAEAEGEAQAAYMTMNGSTWATGSQDYDALLFGSPRLIRNLTITGKRKVPSKEEYIEITPEIIELDQVIKALKLKNREQLIDLAILLGTDYNPDGIPGIGPQKALKLIHEFGSLEKMLNTVLKNVKFPVDPLLIKKHFLDPPINKNYKIVFGELDEKRLIEFLVHEHDFSKDRVLRGIERLKKALSKRKESTLDFFF